MHKKTFIFLSLCLSTQSAFASFLGAINFEQPQITFQHLLDQTLLHAQENTNYLSLGESHLERDTAYPILEKIAKAYIGTTTSNKTRACVEVNTALHQIGNDWLQTAFSSIEIRNGNGPALTDFKKCYQQTSQKHLVYSGFYHQYPWTKNFPGLFTETQVQTQEDNNIASQMQPASGLFVSEIELPYLIEQETRKTLALAAQKETSFSTNTSAIKTLTELLHQKMEKLNLSENKWKSKYGLVLDKSSFSTLIQLPEKFYFILTDLQYRLSQSATYFLDEISKLPNDTRSLLFLLLKQNKWYYQQTHLAPDEQGNPGEVSVDAGRIKLNGNSSILSVALKDGTILFANSNTPELTGLKCGVKKKADVAYSIVSCKEAASAWVRN